jgi:predicted nuclease of predicted toxin-antitoxin system
VDVKAVTEMGLISADDRTVFKAAVADSRIVVTYNNGDFAALFADILRESPSIPGVVFVDAGAIPPSDIGGLVKALVTLADAIRQGNADPSAGLYLTR